MPEWFAKALRDFHPLRVQYWALSDKNPWLWPLSHVAATVHAQSPAARATTTTASSSRQLASECVSAALDLYRDLRDAASEAAFFEVYGNMMSLQMADEREAMRRKGKFDPRSIPGGARSARHDRGRQRGRGPRAHRDADQQGGQRAPPAVADAEDARAPARRKTRSRTCRRTSAAACCRRRRSSSSSSPSARSGRCRSCCAPPPIAGARTRCSNGPKRRPDSTSASAGSPRSCARCCRSRRRRRTVHVDGRRGRSGSSPTRCIQAAEGRPA